MMKKDFTFREKRKCTFISYLYVLFKNSLTVVNIFASQHSIRSYSAKLKVKLKVNLSLRGTRERNYGLNGRLSVSERKSPSPTPTDCMMKTGKRAFDEFADTVSGFAIRRVS